MEDSDGEERVLLNMQKREGENRTETVALMLAERRRQLMLMVVVREDINHVEKKTWSIR